MKKRGILLLIAVCAVLAGGIIGSSLWQPDPNKLVISGLDKLNTASSFRYTITQHQWVSGQDRVLIQIRGEKDGENTRIAGHLIGSDIEMIQAGGNLFNRDPFSKKWVRFNNPNAAQEVFMAELNPLSSLQLKEIGEVVLSGQEKVNGEKAWVCHFEPTVQNQIMEEFWEDFSYTVYVRQSDKTIVKCIIAAKSKAKQEPMSMVFEFQDIGKKFGIQAPNI